SYILGTYGMSTFNSMINSNLLRFSGNYGVFKTDVSVDENGGFEPLDDILGVRYIYETKETFLAETDYKSISKLGDVETFRNENALSLGYAVNKDIDKLSPDESEILENVNALASSMSGCGKLLVEEIPEYEISGEGYELQSAETTYLCYRLVPNQTSETPYVRVGFKVKKAGVYNMYMNYSDYGIITIYVNNEIRRYEFTSFNGILNIGKLNNGDRVDVIIQSENRMADGYSLVEMPLLELRFAYIDENEYASFINVLKSNEMEIQKISGGHIKAKVNIQNGKTLFTTIPYDDGWKVFDDGKQVEIKKVIDTFVGIDLEPGEHELEFRYTPAGFYLGILVSLLSWILFFFYMIYLKRKTSAKRLL
ncbi:MAG: YfhO family protein, partial [Eubacterium sp.]|nr:YfhO family protein [Eubacterium sp.]